MIISLYFYYLVKTIIRYVLVTSFARVINICEYDFKIIDYVLNANID